MPQPSSIGPYLIERELGRGSNGVVYLARHQELQRQVAVKVLLDGREAGETAVRRFQLEAKLLSRLDHPGLVRVFDVGWYKTHCYFVMDYVPGPTLREQLKLGGPLSAEAARKIVLALSRTMSYAHAEGVMHRDLKPSNIILHPRAGPQITDFGLARDERALVHDLTRTGDLLGTPLYMSPEQLNSQKDLDPRVDVYALGLILYECLTGQHPFLAATFTEVADRVLAGEVPPLSKVAPATPPELAAVCMRALAHDRAERFSDAHALAAALSEGASLESLSLDLPSSSAHRRAPVWPWVAAGVAALLLSSLGVSWEVLRRRRAEEVSTARRRSLAAEEQRRQIEEREEQARQAEQAQREEATRSLALLARARELLISAHAASRSEAPVDEVFGLLAEAESASRAEPRLHAEIQLELASYSFRRGRFVEASRHGDALADQPDRIGLQARYVAAFGRIWREQVREGLRELESIWRENPNHPVGLNAGAVFHSYSGMNPKGEVLARKSIAMDPDYVDPYMSLAFCLNDQGKWNEALVSLRRAEELQPDHPRLYMARAFATGNLGRQAEALSAYGRVIDLTMPTPMPRALRHRMQIWLRSGRNEDLRQDATLLLSQFPSDLEALFFRGLAADRLGDLDAARADWHRARRVAPEQFEQLLRRTGDYARRVRELMGRQ